LKTSNERALNRIRASQMSQRKDLAQRRNRRTLHEQGANLQHSRRVFGRFVPCGPRLSPFRLPTLALWQRSTTLRRSFRTPLSQRLHSHVTASLVAHFELSLAISQLLIIKSRPGHGRNWLRRRHREQEGGYKRTIACRVLHLHRLNGRSSDSAPSLALSRSAASRQIFARVSAKPPRSG
jgi:hypothetical protein